MNSTVESRDDAHDSPMGRRGTLRIVVQGCVVLALLGLATFGGAWYGSYAVRSERGLADTRQPLEIKELIQEVRSQLSATEVDMRRRNELPLFKLKDFQMEINFVVHAGSTTKAEVVGVGTDLSTEKERVQKLILNWTACPQHVAGSLRIVGKIDRPPSVVIGPTAVIAAPVIESAASAIDTSNAKAVPDDECR